MLYIFDLAENLVAMICNMSRKLCPYSDVVHSEKLSGENTFTFTVPADHIDAQFVAEGYLVAFEDNDQAWQMFEIKRVVDLHGDGLTKTAYCEHAVYELLDEIIKDIRPTACSATFALTQALTGSRWEVGTVADFGLNSTTFYYISKLASVQDVANVWGGELKYRVVVNGGVVSHRYVDLLVMRGTDTGKQFAYGRNIQEIEREVDLSPVCTALYGRGKGVEVETGGYGRRLDFADEVWALPGDPADKPAGQEWVGDVAALALWGRVGGTRHRYGIFTDDEETVAATLLDKTWAALQERNTPRISYRLTVADLEMLTGYSHEAVRLGDTTRCLDREFSPALLVSARVIELARNLLLPDQTQIVLGNYIPTLADDALAQQKTNATVGDRQGVWDRATSFNPTGTLNTVWLEGIIDILQNEIANSAGYVWLTETDGILVMNAATFATATKAMKIGGGTFALANAKVGAAWDWRAFGDGDGFTADEINAGTINAALVKIQGNTNFYWDGDYLYIINPDNANEQIRLSKEGIRFTQDGGTVWNVAIGFDGIKMEGKPTDPRIWYAQDGQRIYSQDGELVGHLGYYQTLSDQIAAFTRASTAYKQDGSLVASGDERYEYTRMPGPVWSDLFAADLLASEYTSGGDAPATWAVTGGKLTGTGGMQATLIKNDLLIQDLEIEVNSDQMQRGGLVARYQDANNLYWLALSDDSGDGAGAWNVAIQKWFGGVGTNLAVVDFTWARGTSKLIKFTLHGSLLEVFVDGARIARVVDTDLLGGAVGLYSENADPANNYQDFKVYGAQQGVMIEEGTTNLVLYSEQFANAVYGTTGTIVITDNSIVAPNGLTTAATLAGAAAGSYRYQRVTGYNPASKTITFSVWLKAPTPCTCYLVLGSWGGSNYTSGALSVTTLWQRFSWTVTYTAGDTGDLVPYTVVGANTVHAWGAQAEEKTYATSYMQTVATTNIRNNEVLTVPTAGVFTRGRWAVDVDFEPTSPMNLGGGHYKCLWTCITTDGVNAYYLGVGPSAELFLFVYSGGTQYTIASANSYIVLGGKYRISASGDGTHIRLCCNGVQIGADLDYVEPAGALPANMGVGHSTASGQYANGLISDFRISNIARTLAQHQADYNSGRPLEVDEHTTYLMPCNGNLDQVVKRFGLWSKNGEMTLVDPPVSGGIRVYDDAGDLRCHVGQYAVGKYGAKIIDGEIYASRFQTNAEGASAYISLEDNEFNVYENNLLTTKMTCLEGGHGLLYLYERGVNTLIVTGHEGNPGIRAAAGYILDLINLTSSASIRLGTDGSVVIDPTATSNTCTIQGNFAVTGTGKGCIQETKDYGRRWLYAVEAPDIRLEQKGSAQMVDGRARVDLNPIFLQTIEADLEAAPWVIDVTPYFDARLYVSEINSAEGWFIVKECGGGTSAGRVAWSLSAVKVGCVDLYIPEFEPEGDILTSGWEDEYLAIAEN